MNLQPGESYPQPERSTLSLRSTFYCSCRGQCSSEHSCAVCEGLPVPVSRALLPHPAATLCLRSSVDIWPPTLSEVTLSQPVSNTSFSQSLKWDISPEPPVVNRLNWWKSEERRKILSIVELRSVKCKQEQVWLVGGFGRDFEHIKSLFR